jgi:hypothetical protein
MVPWVLVALLSLGQSQTPERKPIPDDSIEIVANGCLKGRVFTATSPRDPLDVRRDVDVTGRSFRLSAKREVMDVVKEHDGHFVEVVGIVRKASLADNAPGRRVGNTRVVLGAPPQRSDPSSMQSRMPMGSVVVMDTTAVRYLSDVCPIIRQ